jgi:hypothetical protein
MGKDCVQKSVSSALHLSLSQNPYKQVAMHFLNIIYGEFAPELGGVVNHQVHPKEYLRQCTNELLLSICIIGCF